MGKIRILNATPSAKGVLAQIIVTLIDAEVPLRDPRRPAAIPLPHGIRADDHWCVDNVALREVLTHKIGVGEASRYFGSLPLGQVTPIPKNCCSEPIKV